MILVDCTCICPSLKGYQRFNLIFTRQNRWRQSRRVSFFQIRYSSPPHIHQYIHKNMELTRDNVVKILRTCLLVSAWFCLVSHANIHELHVIILRYRNFAFFQGMRLSVTFATITDQRERLQTTTDKLSYAFALGTLGSLFSPPLSALSDRFQLLRIFLFHMITCSVTVKTVPGFRTAQICTSAFFSPSTPSSSP